MRVIILCAVLIVLSGCATIFTGSKQDVTFNTGEVDARVYLNLKHIGSTNAPVRIPRRDLNKLITISKEGYEDYRLEMKLKTNPTFWLNIPLDILLVGILTSYLDVALGNEVSTKKEYEIKLKKEK